MRRATVAVAAVLAAVQVLVGTVWWFANLTGLPAYGDSSEYLWLAEELRVDGYRTLAYPLLVRLSSSAGDLVGVPVQVPLYLFQTLVAGAAAWYLVRTAAPRARRRVVAFVAAVIVTSPLVVHYATSLLTDSLAGSFLVIALVGLARVLGGDAARGTLAVTAGGSLGAVLLRTEKAAVLLAVALAAGLWLVLARRRTAAQARGWTTLVAAVLVLAVPALLGSAINRATQTADYGRPEAGIAAAAVSRVIWPHLAEIRDDLPAEVRAQLSAEDATAFDSHNNNALPMTQRMLDMDGGESGVVWAAARATLRCCAVEVVATAGLDAIEYAVAPVTFAVEATASAVTGADSGSPTEWNLTRLSAHRPDLSRALLGTGFLVLAALLVAAVVNRPRRRAVEDADARRQVVVLAIVWLGTVVNGCLFAATMGADANVRYGVSAAVAVTGALAVLAFARADQSEGREEATADASRRGTNPDQRAEDPSSSPSR
jgi:hypothetical protein